MDGGTCTFSNAQSSLPRGKLSIETREGSGASTWEYKDRTSKLPSPGLGASKGFDFKYLMEQLFFSLEAELSAKSSHRQICSEAPSCSPVISPCVVYCDYKTKLCQMQQCMTSSPGDTGAQG